MDPEDARLYHAHQAQQKPAGGAFFESDDLSKYHVYSKRNEVDMKKDFNESIESLHLSDNEKAGLPKQYPHRVGPPPQRTNTYPARSRDSSPGRSPLSNEVNVNVNANASLQIPSSLQQRYAPHAHGHDRSPSHSQTRQGRSPLARASFVQSSNPNEQEAIELEEQQQQGLLGGDDARSRAASPDSRGRSAEPGGVSSRYQPATRNLTGSDRWGRGSQSQSRSPSAEVATPGPVVAAYEPTRRGRESTDSAEGEVAVKQPRKLVKKKGDPRRGSEDSRS
ncbi:hypothetical protein LTS18_000345 [Coniosporium uncinatum]|uniref:Uncharacterized protein n=1 Tax=Coniosporium uncinatum TaxID=93489 RepID=A0ACC3DUR2_9PEZI|nr:hypothetical protein LTS18_000345 [Coniosporium uncinatum]